MISIYTSEKIAGLVPAVKSVKKYSGRIHPKYYDYQNFLAHNNSKLSIKYSRYVIQVGHYND